MKKSLLILSAFSVPVFFVSCKKESSKPISSAEIQGTWSFQSMDVQTSSTQEYTESGTSYKTVTTSDYTTQNNSGTVTFDASSMTANAVSYSASFTAHAIIYTNGTQLSSTDIPFSVPAITSNSSATYELIGADSIHFLSQDNPFAGAVSGAQSSGAKLSLQDNILYMTQNINQVQTQDIGGISMNITNVAKAVIKLQKQ
jgi:hypothetical protein